VEKLLFFGTGGYVRLAKFVKGGNRCKGLAVAGCYRMVAAYHFVGIFLAELEISIMEWPRFLLACCK
jgi:hypothetical protein